MRRIEGEPGGVRDSLGSIRKCVGRKIDDPAAVGALPMQVRGTRVPAYRVRQVIGGQSAVEMDVL